MRTINRELFWSRVNGLATDGCWDWQGMISQNGYGRFGKPPGYAHRMAHWMATGEEPEVVMHTCDNRRCVNPAHLRGGTYLDNNRDCRAKGRDHHTQGTANLPTGVDHHNAKLDPEKVREIRRRFWAGEPRKALVADFGVTYQCITQIVRNVTWREVR